MKFFKSLAHPQNRMIVKVKVANDSSFAFTFIGFVLYYFGNLLAYFGILC
jgi:hypothetical protein